MADGIDLEPLAEYLNSDLAPEACMGLSDLDGFLTGIVIGPELVPRSEWLPVIWGGKEPQFESEDQMGTVLATIMGRYNEIDTCFGSDPEKFQPILWEAPEGKVIASDWAAGFLGAVALRPEAWERLIRHRQAGILLAPLLVLGDTERHAGRLGAADEEKLSTVMPDIIPACVVGIHEFWGKYRDRRGPQPRRNQRPTVQRSR